MIDIVLDNNVISIPERLKVYKFFHELQMKIKEYIYITNEGDIGFFQNLNDVKKGMWRKTRNNDLNGYYFYIDPTTRIEYTIFSEELSQKLGNFPYEPPSTQSQGGQGAQGQGAQGQGAQRAQQSQESQGAQPRPVQTRAYQQTIQSAPQPQQIVQPQQILQNQQIIRPQQLRGQQIIQPQAMNVPQIVRNDPLQADPLTQRVPIYPKLNPENMILNNFMNQSTSQPQMNIPFTSQNNILNQYISNPNLQNQLGMNPKSIQNLNRIAAYNSRQNVQDPSTMLNNWMSNPSQNQTSLIQPVAATSGSRGSTPAQINQNFFQTLSNPQINTNPHTFSTNPQPQQTFVTPQPYPLVSQQMIQSQQLQAQQFQPQQMIQPQQLQAQQFQAVPQPVPQPAVTKPQNFSEARPTNGSNTAQRDTNRAAPSESQNTHRRTIFTQDEDDENEEFTSQPNVDGKLRYFSGFQKRRIGQNVSQNTAPQSVETKFSA
jgi:hypothetical protein